MTLRNLFYKLSPLQRYYVRRFVYLPLDFYEKISGKRQKYIPPKGMVFTGGGDYVKQASLFFEYFKQYCDLKPDSNILDIGSGVGRMAVPFIGYLSNDARYEGIDIVKTGVNWCNKHISGVHHQFNFIHSDIYNDLYNTKGKIKGEAYTFPYAENYFDLVFLTSVFTHMLQAEVEQYLKEISRVLKPRRYCLATFFILNSESEVLMMQSADTFKFPFQQGDYSLMSLDTQTANVAFRQEWIEKVAKENKLKIHQIRYGYWSGRKKEDFPDFQDIIIFMKVE